MGRESGKGAEGTRGLLSMTKSSSGNRTGQSGTSVADWVWGSDLKLGALTRAERGDTRAKSKLCKRLRGQGHENCARNGMQPVRPGKGRGSDHRGLEGKFRFYF